MPPRRPQHSRRRPARRGLSAETSSTDPEAQKMNPARTITNRLIAAFALLLAAVNAFLQNFPGSFSLNGGFFTFSDPFHQGEHFAFAQSLKGASQTVDALSIHGALDFIPSLIGAQLWGGDHHFIPTFAIYALLGTLAALLLFLIPGASQDAARRRGSLFGLMLIGGVAVGYRDFFLLVSLCAFYALLATGLRPGWRTALQLLFGLSTAFGLYWSFDRGIAAAVSLGAATLYLAWADRRFVLSLLSFAAGLVLLANLNDVFSPRALIENVTVLVQTSAQWRYDPSDKTATLTAFALFINLLALGLFWGSHLKARTLGLHAAEAIGLTLLAVLFLKIGTNRVDLQHIHSALWVPGILAIRMNHRNLPLKTPLLCLAFLGFAYAVQIGVQFRSYCLPLIAGLIVYQFDSQRTAIRRLIKLAFLFSLLLVLFSAWKRNGDPESYAWLRSLRAPQSNWQSAEPAMQWVASELLRNKVGCVFDLSNNGIINGLTRLPACSRFIYPVYASAAYEDELIQSLANARPAALVYSSTFWSYRIDGRPMNERFPALDQFILQNYPQQTCQYGYCIRYR